jgi:hypothetical protein
MAYWASDKAQQDNATTVRTPHTYDGNQDDRDKDGDDDTTPITCKHERGLLFLFVVNTVHHVTNALHLLLTSIAGGDVSLQPCDNATTCHSCHL